MCSRQKFGKLLFASIAAAAAAAAAATAAAGVVIVWNYSNGKNEIYVKLTKFQNVNKRH